ncbi:MAG: omptin family outer membrane protease [Candidatus Zixiibacteriota bacterium]|nr:MAG: omptin family outer membrane protease [candidate division Zixibacteria bacterium]
MKHISALILPVILLLTAATMAQTPGTPSVRKLYVFASPAVSLNSGHTEYIMDFYFLDTLGQTQWRKSELEFPLDILLAGAEIGIYSEEGGRTDWYISTSLRANFGNPDGLMKDHDWKTEPGVFDGKFSYTESSTRLSAFLLDINAARLYYSGEKIDLFFLLGFHYQKWDFDIIGYDGWQYNDDSLRINLSSSRKALEYEVTYAMPVFGTIMRINPEKRTGLDLEAALGPVFVSDHDNHLLRNKIGEANGVGYGISLSAEGYFLFGDIRRGYRPFFDLNAGFAYMNASVDQTQRWYGDDPASQDFDDTGEVVPDIPHDIKSLQFGLGLRIGLIF